MSNTPIKRKLEQIIDLNDGFCQTPPSAKKPRKKYTLRITAESQLITAENHHHENNELFLIDDDE